MRRIAKGNRRAAVSVIAGACVLVMLALPAYAILLPGSTFEADDGNLVVNVAGNLDWASASNFDRGDDLPSGSGDNSFGQGAKEDSPVPTVVSGSIPNNKSDLTRFYVSSEAKTVGTSEHLFLYLG